MYPGLEGLPGHSLTQRYRRFLKHQTTRFMRGQTKLCGFNGLGERIAEFMRDDVEKLVNLRGFCGAAAYRVQQV